MWREFKGPNYHCRSGKTENYCRRSGIASPTLHPGVLIPLTADAGRKRGAPLWRVSVFNRSQATHNHMLCSADCMYRSVRDSVPSARSAIGTNMATVDFINPLDHTLLKFTLYAVFCQLFHFVYNRNNSPGAPVAIKQWLFSGIRTHRNHIKMCERVRARICTSIWNFRNQISRSAFVTFCSVNFDASNNYFFNMYICDTFITYFIFFKKKYFCMVLTVFTNFRKVSETISRKLYC